MTIITPRQIDVGSSSFVVHVVLMLCSFIVTPAQAAVDTINLRFDNLSRQVVLKPLQDSLYQVENSQVQVRLAPRLIVKIPNSMPVSQLQQRLPRSLNITTLFVMRRTQYLLVTFSTMAQTLQAMTQLQRDRQILLVQPDLQQKKSWTQITVATPESATASEPDYLQWAAQNLGWPANQGQGSTVAIIDDGFDLSHVEFNQVKTALHYDFKQKKIITHPSAQQQGQHGTKVAGVLFARHNQIAPEGIVPAATFIAITQPDTWTSHTLQSFYLAHLAGADVINCSWHSRWLLQPVVDVVDELAEAGRMGKGTAVVFAAGNEGRELTAELHEAAIRSAISVGALDRNGDPLPKSNFGAMVDLWATGEPRTSTTNNGHYGFFAGTSLSAAVISGYLALMFSADPQLRLQQAQQQLSNKMEQP